MLSPRQLQIVERARNQSRVEAAVARIADAARARLGEGAFAALAPRLRPLWADALAPGVKDIARAVELLAAQPAAAVDAALEDFAAGDAALIDTIKQLSELMVYGDKHDDKFFEYFGEKGIMRAFVDIFRRRDAPVPLGRPT